MLALAGGRGSGAGLIPGRNGFLIFTALLDIGPARGTIVLGVHAGTTFHDCSRGFIEHMDEIVGACSGGNVRVDAPFVDVHKYQIYEYARLYGVPLELTYSCERGTEPPCGSCLSCMDVVLDRRARERRAKTGC
jgi:7-cyano-7-deazaguanine synthase